MQVTGEKLVHSSLNAENKRDNLYPEHTKRASSLLADSSPEAQDQPMNRGTAIPEP